MFFYFLVLFNLIFNFAYSADINKKIKLDSNKPIILSYNSTSWNKDPQKPEVAGLILRDAISGRIVKVEMTESGADTSKFIGHYQINFNNAQSSDLTLEAYIAPLTMLKSEKSLKKIESLIKDGLLLRKPYFVRIDQKTQYIEIFDSREQTLQAYQNYLKNIDGKPLVDSAALAADELAKKAEYEKLQLKLQQEAELNRQKMEAVEKLRQEKLKEEAAKLSAEQKAKRQAEAKALASEGIKYFEAGKFIEAEKKFALAQEKDPENKAYSFQYGVTLFQNNKFNESLVQLSLADGPNVRPVEKKFYQGMAHLKLKEFNEASNRLNESKELNDPNYSPLAAFYLGVIQFQTEKYDPAKENFEYVLDNSKDPKIDEQAESYIEQIANIKKFEEMRKKKFIITLNMGFSYDSNILSASTSSASAPTELAGYRSSYGAILEYRPIFSEHHEFSGIINYSDIYSLNKNFQAESQFQNTDPLTLNFSFPYKWKGVVLEKGAQIGVTPAYETIQMNVDGVNPRETIVNSTIVKTDATLVNREDWFSNYSLELRSDASKIDSSSDDDQTASKITLATSQTFFQDSKKTTAWIYEGSLALNTAKGKNQTYRKIEIAADYLMPWKWETNLLTRLALSANQYPDHTSSRSDTALSLSVILQKQFSEVWSGNSLFSYNKNSSNIDTNTYDKYILMVGASWNGAF